MYGGAGWGEWEEGGWWTYLGLHIKIYIYESEFWTLKIHLICEWLPNDVLISCAQGNGAAVVLLKSYFNWCKWHARFHYSQDLFSQSWVFFNQIVPKILSFKGQLS